MSYVVKVSETVIRKLTALVRGVPFAKIDEVIAGLQRLGANPELGIRVTRGPLRNQMLYQLRVAAPPLAETFSFTYLYDQNEQDLWITGAARGEPRRMRGEGELGSY